MSKQSPFYKTGISRSPLNTHHDYSDPNNLPEGKYEKPGMHEATKKVQNRQDQRTQNLIDRKIKKNSKKSIRNKKKEIRQEGRKNRRNIRKNL